METNYKKPIPVPDREFYEMAVRVAQLRKEIEELVDRKKKNMHEIDIKNIGGHLGDLCDTSDDLVRCSVASMFKYIMNDEFC